ncbi:MAG: type II toxin-antitoxin system RelE/ParE family toxin [Immundisolibacterales bacterium]|nr:type II toxin-antitoxin system RelE/ParE family toxin [Immundisolibacterales bacterium]
MKYYRALVRDFEAIPSDPDGGRDRNLFATGLRSMSYGRHAIFFARIASADNEPVILRIVHQRRHLPALVYFEDLEG